MLKYILLLLLLTDCFADTPATPFDYIKNSPDGNYTIVILSNADRGHDVKTRNKYPSSGIYNKDGTLYSKIDKHMWGAFVTNAGIGFGLGQWAKTDDFEIAGYYICKNNETIGIKVKDYIKTPEELPRSTSHYTSIYAIQYNLEKDRVIIITLESVAIVYNAKNGVKVDVKKDWW